MPQWLLRVPCEKAVRSRKQPRMQRRPPPAVAARLCSFWLAARLWQQSAVVCDSVNFQNLMICWNYRRISFRYICRKKNRLKESKRKWWLLRYSRYFVANGCDSALTWPSFCLQAQGVTDPVLLSSSCCLPWFVLCSLSTNPRAEKRHVGANSDQQCA